MEKNSSISGTILNWVQILALVLGGLWAVWVFVLKDYNNANISIEIKLEKTGQKDGFIAVAADIRANNKSQRTLFLKSSPFVLRGFKNSYKNEGSFDFIQRVNSAFERYESVNSKIQNDSIEVIAAGQLYIDEFIQSNEMLRTSQIFYINKDAFDHIELEAFIYSTKCKSDTSDLNFFAWLSTSECDKNYSFVSQISNQDGFSHIMEIKDNNQNSLSIEERQKQFSSGVYDYFTSTQTLSLWGN